MIYTGITTTIRYEEGPYIIRIDVRVMREQTACFTGHRTIPPQQLEPLTQRLWEAVEEAIHRGYRYFGAGGALGFDTLAAQTVLEFKKVHPQVRLILVLPCPSQAERWRREQQQTYQTIRAQADKVVYTSPTYHRGCMHQRNRHLVDHSSLCISYLTQPTGGTAYTVDYATAQGLEVVNLGTYMTEKGTR